MEENLGVSVRMFLRDGTPGSVKELTKTDWTGRVITCARPQLKDVVKSGDFARTGIYILVDDEVERVYVGETGSAETRLPTHASGRGKDFWTRMILAVSDRDDFTKSHALYVEQRLLAIARENDRAHIENGTKGTAPRLSAADRADAERFLRELRFLLPLVGVHVFNAPPTQIASAFGLKGKTFHARGQLSADNHFIVDAGAEFAPRLRDSAPPSVARLRNMLAARGLLKQQGGKLILQKPHEFTSPSAAAGAIVGGAANGLTLWKDAKNRTLKELERG